MPPSNYLAEQDRLARDLEQQAAANAREAEQAQREAQRTQEQAQTEAERAQKEQAREAQRAQNTAVESQYQAQDRPQYTDAYGNIRPQHDDATWEAQQAAKKKAAEDKLGYIKQGIKHTTNPVDGSVIALETPADVEKRKADRAEMLRRRAIDTEVKALRTEADNPELQKLRLTEAQRTRADKQLKKAQDDARYALQAKLGTQAKAVTGGNDYIPFNEAPAPEAVAATERLKRLQDPAADLTDDDLNDLATDPVTKPLAERIANTRAQIAKADEANKFHDERAAKIWDAEMRRDNPAKWAEMQKQKLTDPKAIEAGTADFEARKAAHEQAVAPIIARRQQTEQQLAALEQQNLDRVASGIPAGDLVTFTGPDGQPQSWSKELAAKRAALQAQEQEWQTTNADQLETLDIEGRQLNDHAALLNEASVQAQSSKLQAGEAARAQQIEAIRSTPGLSRHADQIAGLDQEAAIRAQDIADMYPQDGPERQAALAAIQTDIGAKHTAIAQDMQARQQTVEQVYQGMIGAETEAAKASGSRLSGSEHRDAATIALQQSLGVSQQEARTMLDDAQKQDWRGAGTATAEGDLVLKGLRAIGAKGQPGRDYIESEPVRILSTGAITVNPKLLADPKAYEKAVMAAEATPEAKAAAMRALPDARRELGKQALTVFNEYGASGFKEWKAKQLQAPGSKLQADDEIGLALGYADHLKADTGPIGRLLDQVVRRSATGIMSLGSQILGLGALATGSETLAQGAGAIDNYVGLSRQMQDFTGANDSLFNRAVGQTAEIAPSMLVSLGGGMAARGALIAVSKTRPGLALLGTMSKSLRTAKTTAQATAAFGKLAEGVSLTGAAIAGGAQTAGAQFAETYAALRDEGLAHDDAVKASRAPALLSGAVTSLLTLGFGKTGVERLLANPEAAKTLARGRFASILKKAGLSDRAAAVMAAGGKGMLEEQPEEMLDELFNQVSTELTKGNGASIQSVLADFIDNLPELAIAIGVMGGAAGAAQGYRESVAGGSDAGTPGSMSPATTNPANLPETVAAAETAIDNLAAPDLDPQTLARTQDAARSILYVAQGTPLEDLPADSLAALDIVEDPKNPGQFINGKIVAGKDGATKLVTYTGGQVSDPATGALRPVRVRMQDGQPIISQQTLDKLQTILPAVRAAIPLDENTRKQQLTQPGTKNQEPGTPTPSPQDSVQAPAPAGAQQAPSNQTSQPDAPTVDGGTTNVLPQAAAQPGTGNRELGTPSAKKRATELANALVDLGLPDGPAASAAAAIVAKHGVKGDLYTEQFVSKEFRKAAEDLGLSGAWSTTKAKENPLKAPADLDARLAAFSGSQSTAQPSSTIAQPSQTPPPAASAPLAPRSTSQTASTPVQTGPASTSSPSGQGPATTAMGVVDSPQGEATAVPAAASPDLSPTAHNTEKFMAARQATLAKVPVAERPRAMKLFSALDKALTAYGPAFPEVRYVSPGGKGALGYQGMGIRVIADLETGAIRALEVNLPELVNGMRSMDARAFNRILDKAVKHELRHVVAGRVIKPDEARVFWKSMPRSIQQRVYASYHHADILNALDLTGKKQATWKQHLDAAAAAMLDKAPVPLLRDGETLPKPDAFAMAHEFLRMLDESNDGNGQFAGEISEAADADPGWGEAIVRFLKSVMSEIRRLIDTDLDAETRVTLRELETRIEKARKKLLADIKRLDTAPASTTPDNLAGGTDSRASVIPQTTAQPSSTTAQPLQTAVLGAPGTAYTDSNDAIDFQWAVVDVNSLNISNRDDGSIDPSYPQELQPRDRQSAGSEAQVADIAKNFNLDRLSASNSVGDGAPIIGTDGVVESGNGRMMGARRAYSKGRAAGPSSAAQTYREALLKRAADFGLHAEQVEAVANPVLVRIRTTEVNRPQFVLSANVSTIAPKRDIEQAKIDAKQIVPDLFDSFVPSEDGEVFTAANAEFIKGFIGAVVPPAERPGVIDAAGNLSQSGLRRLRNALFVHAYGASPESLNALGRLTESIDATDTNIARALIAMAPRFAEQNARIANGALQPVSITDELTAALQTLTDLRNRGEKVSDWLLQDRIPGIGDDPGPVATALVQYLFDNRQRPRQIIEALDRYAKAVDSAGDPRQMSIFGDEKPTKLELWKMASKSAEKQAALAMGGKVAARKIGVGITVFDKTIKTPYGSRYYHATFDGDWYHIRLADHSNKSATGGDVDRLFRGLQAHKSGSGMTHPHELNVLLSEPAKTENEAFEVIRRVLVGLPDAAKYRTQIDRLPWEKDQSPQIYGNEVDVDAQYNRLNYSFEGQDGERFDEEPPKEKRQSRAENQSDMPGRGQTGLATTKTGEAEVIAPSSETVNASLASSTKAIAPKDALRTYRTLTKAQESAPLNAYQSKALEKAETALGQTFLFDDAATRVLKPAEDLVLETQSTGNREPGTEQPTQLSLFSGSKSAVPFIKPLENSQGEATLQSNETARASNQSAADPNRDRAVGTGLSQEQDSRGNQPDGNGQRQADRSQDGRGSAVAGVELAELDPVAFTAGIQSIPIQDRFKGQEHEVYHDRASNRAVKMTEPGQFGARSSRGGYLLQMREMNDLFPPGVTIEGTVQIQGESGPRIITSQPWIAGRESALPEIDTYMRRKGFLRMYDGAWWHPGKEMQVTDALPKNFITSDTGHVHPIDLILAWPPARAHERIENIVNSQPQPDPTPEPEAMAPLAKGRTSPASTEPDLFSFNFGLNLTPLLSPAQQEAKRTQAVLAASTKTVTPEQRREALTGATTTVQGQPVSTGTPVTFKFLHNKESATKLLGKPKKDSDFDRGFEPSGRFVTETTTPWLAEERPEQFIGGILAFENPIVLDSGEYGAPTSWKRRLSAIYGNQRGKALSKAIIADGYDGVITAGKYGPSEILDLTTFDESLALYAGTKTPKEQPRNLATVHNLSIDNLRHALKMGGLPVPSMAIIRTDLSTFDNFGEITLVAPPSLIDPRENRQSKVFNADVYSPRYPQVTTILKPGDGRKLSDSFDPWREETLPAIPSGAWSWSSSKIADDLKTEGFGRLKDNPLVTYGFLRSKGEIEPPAAGIEDYKYRDELRKMVNGREPELEMWLRNRLSDLKIYPEEKIFNGFTYSGNKRYLPHNLDTVVKLLKKELKDGEGFNYGVPSIRAANAKPFRSLKAIQEAREHIIPEAQMEALKEEVNKEFLTLSESLLPMRSSGREGFGALDAVSDDMKAMVQGGSENWKHLREMYPGEDARELVFKPMSEFLNKLRHMPSEYFEGKIQRAVFLNEFAGAVVPDNTPQDLIDALEQRKGLEVVSYPKNDKAARAVAVKEMAEKTGALFASSKARRTPTTTLAKPPVRGDTPPSSPNREPGTGNPLQPQSYDSAPIDPYTGARSLITGSRVGSEQGQAIGALHAERLRRGLREGREVGQSGPALAASRSRAFSVDGRDALPRVPILSAEQFDRLTSLHEIGEGSEATVYADKAAGVVYKVLGGFQKSPFLGIWPEVYYNIDGQLDYMFKPADRPRQLAARIAVQTLLGGTPTEIAGIGPNGQVILKQPLSPDAETSGRDPARRLRSLADAGLVRIPPGLFSNPNGTPDTYVAVVEGRPWLVADLMPDNFVADNQQQARVSDPVVAFLPPKIIAKVPGLASVVREAGQQAHALGDRRARLFASSKTTAQPPLNNGSTTAQPPPLARFIKHPLHTMGSVGMDVLHGSAAAGAAVAQATGVDSTLAALGTNRLDKTIAAALERVAEPKVQTAKDAVEAWLNKPDGLSPTARGIVEQLAPNALLPREYLAMVHEMQRKTAFGQETANDLLRALSDNPRLSDLAYPAEFAANPMYRTQLFDAMENKIPMSSLTPEMQRLGERLREMLRDVGRELVKQGLMNADTFAELDSNGWMPRYNQEEAEAAGGGWLASFKLGIKDLQQQRSTAYHIVDTTRKDKTGQYLTVNREEGGKRNRWRFRDAGHRNAFYSDFIREQALKMLQDGGQEVNDMLAPLDTQTKRDIRAEIKTLTRASMNLPATLSRELAGMVKQAIEHQKYRFKKEDPYDPPKLIKDPVYSTARYILSQTHNAATMELLRDVAKNGEWVSDVDLNGFKAIPDSSRFGPLAGKFVREDIARQILDMVNVPNAALQFYDAIMRKWKSGKLVWNPGSHLRDAVGNLYFAQLAGNSLWNPGNLQYYRDGMSIMRGDKGPEAFAELIEHQVLGGDAYSNLVKEKLKGLLPDMKTVENSNPGRIASLLFGFGAKFHAAHEALAALRRFPDDFYKVAAFLKYKADGMTPEHAAAEVRKWFPFYDRLGSSATTQAAGRFVNPFLSFFRESSRILATAAAQRPLALIGSLAFPAAITAISAIILGLDDDDEEEIKKDMTGRGKLFLSPLHLFSMLLPWRSSTGNVQQFDISAVMPFADLLGQKVVPLEEKENRWQTFWRQIAAAGPVGNLGVSWITNRDLFSGRHITEADMGTGEMASSLFGHAARVMLPPLAPDVAGAVGLGDGGPLTRMGERQVNKTLQTYDPTQTVLRSVLGMNIKSAAPSIYREADDFRASIGADTTPGFDYGTTAQSRGKRLLVHQLAQDKPNLEAIKNLVGRLRLMGVPLDTPKDIQNVVRIIDPAQVIGGSKKAGLTAEDARARFRATRSPESRRLYEESLNVYQTIKNRAPGLIMQAMAAQ